MKNLRSDKQRILILFNMLLLLCCLTGCSRTTSAQKTDNIKLGAYYFDGWTGKTMHIKDKLVADYSERMPKWGWKTSNKAAIEEQIDLAYDAGISFFSFCWYYGKDKTVKGVVDNDPKNNALKLYLKARNKDKLGFNLMVSNHEGYVFKETDWDDLCKFWISHFKIPGYVMVNDKPLITFFSMASLKQTFGSTEKVKAAFLKLNNMAKAEGLNGVTIAANATSINSVSLAESCGVDILTGYNYHTYGLKNRSNQEVLPIDSMQVKERQMWDQMSVLKKKAYIPVVTLNWDKRPTETPAIRRSPRFEGYSGKSVEKSVYALKKWVNENTDKITDEKIAVVYAWNEYGEGAWLTPSERMGSQLLDGFKAGMRKK